MSIKDIIKNSFLQQYQTETISVQMILLYLLSAALIGVFIFLIYRIMTKTVFYSKTFNLTLMLLCVITAAIIMAVQNSIVVSLGMVGALSIVRFRTAIKEPLDLAFLFWSISAGIIVGARMVGLAVVLSLVVTALLFLFQWIPETKKSMLLLVKSSDAGNSSDITKIVKKHDKHYQLKSKAMVGNDLDLVFEIKMEEYDTLIDELHALKDIVSVSLVAHKGEAVF